MARRSPLPLRRLFLARRFEAGGRDQRQAVRHEIPPPAAQALLARRGAQARRVAESARPGRLLAPVARQTGGVAGGALLLPSRPLGRSCRPLAHNTTSVRRPSTSFQEAVKIGVHCGPHRIDGGHGMDQRAMDRTLGQRIADVLWSKYTRLPAATTSYALTRDL